MLDRLFLQIVNMSFTASFVILAVMAVRLLLKKAPRVISYALWAVVLFRLVCPFSFESALSLLPINANPIPQEIVYQQTPEINTGIPFLNDSINAALPAATPDNSMNPLQGWLAIGTFLWLVGIAALAVYSVVSLLLLKRRLRGAVCEGGNIYLDAGLVSPFVMGLLRPKIYLPASLPESEKRYILLHERMHIKRLDHAVKMVSFAVLCLHWFNPLAWAAFFLCGKDMETSCDEAVIQRLGSEVKKDYSSSLLTLATGRRIVGGSLLAFGEGDTKSRIKNVLSYKKPAFWVLAVSIIAVAAVGIGLMANPKNDSIPIPKSNEVMSIRIEQMNEGESLGMIESADKSEIETILQALQNTDKTMQEPVNDSPKQDDYFRLDLNGSPVRKFYLYSNKNQYYIEEPYGGIYRASREVSVSIAKIYIANGGADVKNTDELWDMRPMIMVDGVLYLDTGKEVSGNVEDSAILGEVTSAAGASEKPTENGQCNFNSGVGARYAAYNDGIAVFLDKKWYFFEKETDIAEKLTHGQAVTSALFSLGNDYSEGECIAEGHIILGCDDSDKDKTKIYALAQISWYGFENDNFVEVSGGASPAVITLNSDNTVSIEQPMDGSGYAKSIEEMFPKEYHDRIFNYKDADRKNLKQQEEKYASEYLSKIGRSAKIGDYSDFDYHSLTDLGVSVEVSNNLYAFYKEHNYYPGFIGTRERLENGVRMIYEMSYHENQNEIRFTKYDYDTKKILEQFIADSNTGNIAE